MATTKFRCEKCGQLHDTYNEAEKCELRCKKFEEDLVECHADVIAKLILFKHEDYYELPREYQKDIVANHVTNESVSKLWDYLREQREREIYD